MLEASSSNGFPANFPSFQSIDSRLLMEIQGAKSAHLAAQLRVRHGISGQLWIWMKLGMPKIDRFLCDFFCLLMEKTYI